MSIKLPRALRYQLTNLCYQNDISKNSNNSLVTRVFPKLYKVITLAIKAYVEKRKINLATKVTSSGY